MKAILKTKERCSMPPVGSISNATAASKTKLAVTQKSDQDGIINQQTISEQFTDRFEKITKISENTQKPNLDTLSLANEILEKLIIKDKYLNNLILAKKKAVHTQLNSPTELLTIALNLRGKDLKEMLDEAQTGRGGTNINNNRNVNNELFLFNCYKFIFGNNCQSVTDWLQLTISNLPPGTELYNLFDYYQEELVKGKILYDKSAQLQQTKIKLLAQQLEYCDQQHSLISQDKAAKAFLQEAEIELKKTDRQIAGLTRNCRKNQDEINLKTEYYLMNAKLKERSELNIATYKEQLLELTDTLSTLEVRINENNTLLDQTCDSIHLYEKKLALIEVLLGYDLDQEGDPQRIQLIQRAISTAFNEFENYKISIGANSTKVFTVQVELQELINKYEQSTSIWDKFWLKQDIKSKTVQAHKILSMIKL